MCRVTIISWGQTAGVRVSQVRLPWSVAEQSIWRSISAGHLFDSLCTAAAPKNLCRSAVEHRRDACIHNSERQRCHGDAYTVLTTSVAFFGQRSRSRCTSLICCSIFRRRRPGLPCRRPGRSRRRCTHAAAHDAADTICRRCACSCKCMPKQWSRACRRFQFLQDRAQFLNSVQGRAGFWNKCQSSPSWTLARQDAAQDAACCHCLGGPLRRATPMLVP